MSCGRYSSRDTLNFAIAALAGIGNFPKCTQVARNQIDPSSDNSGKHSRVTNRRSPISFSNRIPRVMPLGRVRTRTDRRSFGHDSLTPRLSIHFGSRVASHAFMSSSLTETPHTALRYAPSRFVIASS